MTEAEAALTYARRQLEPEAVAEIERILGT